MGEPVMSYVTGAISGGIIQITAQMATTVETAGGKEQVSCRWDMV